MKLCVVGNGPNARGCGAAIDQFDFVVRTTGFWVSGPNGTGSKLDAYAWFGAQEQIPPFPHSFEHWITLPIRYANPPSGYGCHWQNVAYHAALRPIRWVPDAMWWKECACISALSSFAPFAPPSTGFTAVDMALRIFEPEELWLYGFDGTVQGKPGWGDNNPQWRDDGPHDLYVEKLLIHRLMTTGEWLGKPCGTRVVWPHCPIGKVEETDGRQVSGG